MADKGNQNIMAGIDEMMYSCGVDILHPGGFEKTFEMAVDCGINNNSNVLDIGSGKGVSACSLVQEFGCFVTGIDMSEKMVDYANRLAGKRGLSGKVVFTALDAHRLPYKENTFDIVLAECSTVLMDKEKAYSEFLRVTKPGGYIADLEMCWKKKPDQKIIDKAYEMWGGFATKTFDEWRDFYKELGLSDIRIVDFSDKLRNMEWFYMKMLGVSGIMKMCWQLMKNKGLRKGMNEYNEFFKQHKDYIGYGYFVGRKKI